MTSADLSSQPRLLANLPPDSRLGAVAELKHLEALRQAGATLAPICLVPAAAEENFYHLNNLSEKLRKLAFGLDLHDPDEDEVEDVALEAHTLLQQHFLLDEFIDLFYAALERLPARVRIRRPAEAGRVVMRNRLALLALKDTWEDSWTPEALLQRLRSGGSLVPPARPVLLHTAGDTTAEGELSLWASKLLGNPVKLFKEPASGITRVIPRALPRRGE